MIHSHKFFAPPSWRHHSDGVKNLEEGADISHIVIDYCAPSHPIPIKKGSAQ